MVKLRLRRGGAKKKPHYRIVAADVHSPRDGRFIEIIGYYSPITKPKKLELDVEKALTWLKNGAQPTETVRSLLRKKGVLEMWHRVRNGASIEEVLTKVEEPPVQTEEPVETEDSEVLSEESAEETEATTETVATDENEAADTSDEPNSEESAPEEESAEKTEG